MTHSAPLKIKKLHAHATLPAYKSKGASGFDIHACLEKPLDLVTGQRARIPTGLAFEIPESHEGQIRSRSGLAHKHGIIVLNSPGTIDSDYRGEIQIILINMGSESFRITHNMRIAQVILQRIERLEWIIVDELSQTQRGGKGFGSTGITG